MISTRCTPSPHVRQYKDYCRANTDVRSRDHLISSCDDRFIPSRRDPTFAFVSSALLSEEKHQQANRKPMPSATPQQKAFQRFMKSSLYDVPLESLNDDGEFHSLLNFGVTRSAKRLALEDPTIHDILKMPSMNNDTPQGASADKPKRLISHFPLRTLDLPCLVDDFYLNIMSWSEDNIIAIALDASVYLYDFTKQKVEHVTTVQGDVHVTSVSWWKGSGRSKFLAIATSMNTIEIWDTQSACQVRRLRGLPGTVGSLDWNQQWLTSGGSDSSILQHDIRTPTIISEYAGHTGRVCGLAWNAQGKTLASGGCDNTVHIWDACMSSRRPNGVYSGGVVSPQVVLTGHTASVKALAWCPFREGALASGGGRDDTTIKLWNTHNGHLIKSVTTNAQVSGLAWSKQYPELVSSHGYGGNNLIVWKYPDLDKAQILKGHGSRVLYMATSPDGNFVASAGVDEMLNFWDITGNGKTMKGTAKRSSALRDDYVVPGTPTVR